MRIVVIGGAGFVGRHVVAGLIEAGHAVHTLDLHRPNAPLPGERCDVIDLARQRGPEDGAARCGGVEAVVWLAATIRQITTLDARALEDLDVMVEAPLRFLEALAPAPRAFVHASSIQVYGRPLALPVDEAHATDPFTVYGAAKLCAEHYLDVACGARGIAASHLRIAFVHGPGQHSGNVIPRFLDAVQRGERPIIHGSGDDLRDDVHVEDVARAFALAVEHAPTGRFNVASGRANSLREVAEACCRLAADAGLEPAYEDRESHWIDRWYRIDAAREAFGFRPTLSLEAGLERTWLARGLAPGLTRGRDEGSRS